MPLDKRLIGSFYITFPFLLTFAVRRIENLEVSEINIRPSVVQRCRELELVAGPDESVGDIPTPKVLIVLRNYIHPVIREKLAQSRGRSIMRNWRERERKEGS